MFLFYTIIPLRNFRPRGLYLVHGMATLYTNYICLWEQRLLYHALSVSALWVAGAAIDSPQNLAIQTQTLPPVEDNALNRIERQKSHRFSNRSTRIVQAVNVELEFSTKNWLVSMKQYYLNSKLLVSYRLSIRWLMFLGPIFPCNSSSWLFLFVASWPFPSLPSGSKRFTLFVPTKSCA